MISCLRWQNSPCFTPSRPMTAPITWHQPCMPGHFCIQGMAKGMQIPPTDPRFRLAYDIYNQAVAQGLAAPSDAEENEVRLKAGNYKLPFGTLQVSLDESGMSWGGYPLDRFISTTALEVDGLRNRYHNSGIGVPLAASLAKTPSSEKKVAGSNRLPPNTKVPVTALLRFDNARAGLSKGKIQGRIEVYATDQTSTVTIDGQKQPMESDATAAFAYQLNDSPIYAMEIAGFFNGVGLHQWPDSKRPGAGRYFYTATLPAREDSCRVSAWHRIESRTLG